MLNGILLTAGEGVTDAVEGFDLVGIMETAITTVQNNIFDVLTIVVPAIAIIVGAVVGVKFGVKWLKSLGKA